MKRIISVVVLNALIFTALPITAKDSFSKAFARLCIWGGLQAATLKCLTNGLEIATINKKLTVIEDKQKTTFGPYLLNAYNHWTTQKALSGMAKVISWLPLAGSHYAARGVEAVQDMNPESLIPRKKQLWIEQGALGVGAIVGVWAIAKLGR